MTNAPIARIENIIVQEFENEVLVYDLSKDKALCLNQTSALIWQMCDGKSSPQQISCRLTEKLKTPIPEDLIWLALEQFKREDLLTKNAEFEINFGGLNRRQIIKKIGLASMVMLPIISSVVSPTAANAASLAPLLAFCSNSTQCDSGNCDNNVTPRRCCVPGSSGVASSNFCCADPPSCNLSCCTGTGTGIIPFAPCQTSSGLPLRVTCP